MSNQYQQQYYGGGPPPNVSSETGAPQQSNPTPQQMDFYMQQLQQQHQHQMDHNQWPKQQSYYGYPPQQQQQAPYNQYQQSMPQPIYAATSSWPTHTNAQQAQMQQQYRDSGYQQAPHMQHTAPPSTQHQSQHQHQSQQHQSQQHLSQQQQQSQQPQQQHPHMVPQGPSPSYQAPFPQQPQHQMPNPQQQHPHQDHHTPQPPSSYFSPHSPQPQPQPHQSYTSAPPKINMLSPSPQQQSEQTLQSSSVYLLNQLASPKTPPPLLKQQLTKCTFILKTPIVIDMQREAFYLVGSAPQTGRWDLINAIRLSPMDRQGTQWQVVIDLNTDSLIEYKYVVKGSTMQPARWESLPANRLLNTHKKKEVRLVELWGDVEVSEDWVPLRNSPEQSHVPHDNRNRQDPHSDLLNGSRSSFHSMMHHFQQAQASQQNRLTSTSEASFINEDTQHVWPVEMSSLQREAMTPTADQPFAVTQEVDNNHHLHKVESKLSAGFPQQQQPAAMAETSPSQSAQPQVPHTKMRKALQQAFRDYESNDKKDNVSNPVLSEEESAQKVAEMPFEPPAQIELDYNEPILHVAYMLPYRLEKSPRKPNEFVAIQCYHTPTFLFGTLDYLGQQKKFNFYWVGIISTENKLTEVEEAQARAVLKEKKCFPVFLTLKEIQTFLVYYESLIKPKMHNFLNIADDSTFVHDNWSSYVTINQKIAGKVIEVKSQIKDLKMIWVHGDHLMLVPQYVRKAFSQANLGFYFHSAFPASAVFSTLYYRRELLQALLQVDLVGFHLFEYARNFLNTCHRLFNLNLDYSNGGFMSVNYHGRIVGVRVSHIGIDEEFIQHIMSQSAFKKQVERFKAEFRQITEAARKSQLQSQAANWGSRSSANIATNLQNRLTQQRGDQHAPHTSKMGAEANISTSQSSNSIHTLQEQPNQSGQNSESKAKPIVICSIDTFTHLSGFITKLKGYQKFLQSYPSYRNKIVLIQFIPSIYCNSDISSGDPEKKETAADGQTRDNYMTDSISTLRDLRNEIIQITQEVHKEFGTHCLILQEGNPPLAKRLAVWSQSQILLIATLKDGLCLPPLEFVTVKKILNDFHNSSMILSEYSGCSNAFSGFHNFNSFNLLDICQSLDAALSTTSEKKAEMMAKAYNYSSRRTFKKWVDSFLKDLKQMYNPTSTVAARYIYLGLRTEANLLTHQKVIATPLDIDLCAQKFGKSGRCLVLIDHEALPRKQFGRGEMQPTDQTIMDLAEITQDSRNTVALLSSESRNYVQKVFNRVTNLWLAAESGYEYRINGQWNTMFKISSKGWLKILKKVMQEYCDNVDGSCVEERNSTIVWNYKNAEEEHGDLCAKELYLQIKHLIGPNAPIEIVQGNGFLEVKPVQLQKTTLLTIFLQELAEQLYTKVDFLLYIGADTSDEPVFEQLKQLTKSSSKSKFFSQDCHVNLCILGKKPSKADFYVDEIEKLAILINKLGIETKRRKKNRSYNDLNELNFVVAKQKLGGLGYSGQSTNDLSQKLQSFQALDLPSDRKNRGFKFKTKLDTQVPILEQDPLEEESNMNFAESLRSPLSSSNGQVICSKSVSSHDQQNDCSQSQNFTFAVEPTSHEGHENDVISKSNSYRDLTDLNSPKQRRNVSDMRLETTPNSERPLHDISMPQLAQSEALAVNAMQKKQGQAVTQQIKVVLREEQQEYQAKK